MSSTKRTRRAAHESSTNTEEMGHEIELGNKEGKLERQLENVDADR